MKGSRITAFGLVAGATLWIASGHFLPHESAESRAAVRTGDSEVKKLFRVAVAETYVVPHSRKLTLSGRTEADKRVVINSRANGEVKEVRVKRGSVVKAGDIIAILSDEAREAQVVQAQSIVTQRRTELEAKRGLLASGAIPRLEGVNLEAQFRIAEANLALALAERERGIVRAPWAGVIVDLAVEVGPGIVLVLRQGYRFATGIRSDAGGGRGGRAQARRHQGRPECGGASRHRRDRSRPHSIRVEDRERHHAYLPGRGRTAQCRRRDPRRHHRGGVDSAGAGRGDAGAALGADLFVRRRARRAQCQRRERRRLLLPCR